MTLRSLVPKVGKHNMGKVSEVEKMRKVKGMEKMERVREVEKAIGKIK